MSAPTSESRVPNYRLGERLGAGAMGAVYLARRVSDGAKVAIKIIHPEHIYNPRLVTRFLAEARAITQIDHEHVIKVFECTKTSDGECVIVMELIDGESLRALLDRAKILPLSRATEIAVKIALGVSAAHAQGIVHRDLKPDNVMLGDASPDSDEQVKVLDFGVAKIAGDVNTRLTMTGTIIGTPDYMAPEMISNPMQATPTADIYALGCMLFEMCTGSTPFSARGYEVLVRQLHDAPPSPSALNPEIPVWLESIILRAMAKDPAQRFQSMDELANALVSSSTQAPLVSTKRGRAVLKSAQFPRRPLAELEAIYSAPTKIATQPGRSTLQQLQAPPEAPPAPMALGEPTDLHSAPTQLGVLRDRTEIDLRAPLDEELHSSPTKLCYPTPLPIPMPGLEPPTGPRLAALPSAQQVPLGPVVYGFSDRNSGTRKSVNPTADAPPISALRRAFARPSGLQRLVGVAAMIVAVVLGSFGIGRALRRPPSPSFTIDTQPAGATVYDGELRLGRTPLIVYGAQQNVTHELRLEKDGYAALVVTIAPAGNTRALFQLSPLVSDAPVLVGPIPTPPPAATPSVTPAPQRLTPRVEMPALPDPSARLADPTVGKRTAAVARPAPQQPRVAAEPHKDEKNGLLEVTF